MTTNLGYILLVEDNQDDIDLTLRALKQHNVANEVLVVNDGVEALELLLGQNGNPPQADALPQVILLDLKLPRMDGHELLEKLRAHPRTALLPVIMLTSSNQEEDVVRSYKLGANSYVRKPVDYVEFTEAVRQLGLYWLLINKAPPQP